MLETFMWLLAKQLVLPFCSLINNSTILCHKLRSAVSSHTLERLSMHRALPYMGENMRLKFNSLAP